MQTKPQIRIRVIVLLWIGLILYKNNFFDGLYAQKPKEKKSNSLVWLDDYERALTKAKTENKMILIDFFATWCAPCKQMEYHIFSESEVSQRMQDFVLLKIDIDLHEEMLEQYQIKIIPTIVILDPQGQFVKKWVGYPNVSTFLEFLLSLPPQKKPSSFGILGEKAPPFEVKKWLNLPEEKEILDLSDYQGKILYLYCFQSWCPGCHQYGFPTLKVLIEHYQDNKDVRFVAIQTAFEGFANNSFEHAKKVSKQYELSIPIGHTGEASALPKIMQHYKTGGTPWVVVIDSTGIVQYNDFHIKPEDAITLIEELIQKKEEKNREDIRK